MKPLLRNFEQQSAFPVVPWAWLDQRLERSVHYFVKFGYLSNKKSVLSNLTFISRTNEAILLALYEAVHLNRNFITVLAQVTYNTFLCSSMLTAFDC